MTGISTSCEPQPGGQRLGPPLWHHPGCALQHYAGCWVHCRLQRLPWVELRTMSDKIQKNPPAQRSHSQNRWSSTVSQTNTYTSLTVNTNMQIMQVIKIQVAHLCCITVSESLKRKGQTWESSVDPGATTVSQQRKQWSKSCDWVLRSAALCDYRKHGMRHSRRNAWDRHNRHLQT